MLQHQMRLCKLCVIDSDNRTIERVVDKWAQPLSDAFVAGDKATGHATGGAPSDATMGNLIISPEHV